MNGKMKKIKSALLFLSLVVFVIACQNDKSIETATTPKVINPSKGNSSGVKINFNKKIQGCKVNKYLTSINSVFYECLFPLYSL